MVLGSCYGGRAREADDVGELGDRTFHDFSGESGLRAVQVAFVFADVDNDGDRDCFAGLDIELAGETSAIYSNDGKGHFTKKAGSGLKAAELAANGVFGDFDGDGRLEPKRAASTHSRPETRTSRRRGVDTTGSRAIPKQIVGSNGFGIDGQDIDGDGHMDVWLAAARSRNVRARRVPDGGGRPRRDQVSGRAR